MEKANKGQRQTHHTEEEKIEVAKKICDLYASQNATIESCCDACGIGDRTFRLWAAQIPEVAELYKAARTKADDTFFDMLRPKVRNALERLVNGHEYTETKKETGEMPTGSVDKTTEVGVIIQPNPSAVIFLSKGIWPEKFAERKQVEHSGEIKSGEPKKTIEILFRDRPLENESKEDGPTGRE